MSLGFYRGQLCVIQCPALYFNIYFPKVYFYTAILYCLTTDEILKPLKFIPFLYIILFSVTFTVSFGCTKRYFRKIVDKVFPFQSDQEELFFTYIKSQKMLHCYIFV